MEGLAPEQAQGLERFKEITNWSASDSEAVSLLQAANWNVETAVMLHFEGPDAPSSAPDGQAGANPASPASSGNVANASRYSISGSSSQQRQPTSLLEELEQEALNQDFNQEIAPRVNPNPPVYAPRGNGGFSIIQAVIMAPISVGYRIFNTVLYFLSWLFPFLPRLTGYYPANRHATRVSSRGLHSDPQTIASRFIQRFEERYGQNEIPFYRGGYTQALELAKTELKYLIVILQSDEHDLTDQFNRKVMLDPRVVAFFKRPDIVVWAGNVKESEAYQVATGLEVTRFPFGAVIAPSPKSPTSPVLVMTVLSKLRGEMNAGAFISTIEEKMETHQPKLLALVLDKQERELSRRLREEQDSAYQKSLAADRERETKAREEKERLEKEERDRIQLEQDQDQWKKWKAQEIYNKLKNAEGTEEKKARISIRLLSGERVVQSFRASDTVEDVYGFVECYDLIKGWAEDNDSDQDREPPANYVHEYGFELVSPMPRKVLDPGSTLIKEEGALWPNGSLIVELNDDEDEDDD